MKTKLVLTALVTMLAFGFAAQVGATTITFDDLTTPSGGSTTGKWGLVPASYADFTWTNWEVTLADGTAGSYQQVYRNTYGAPSLNNFAYNADGVTLATTTGTVFNFIGAQVTSFAGSNQYQSYSSRNLTVNGYLGATLVGTQTVTLSPSSFQALTANFMGIDKLTFQNSGGSTWWGLDDFEYTTSVPDGGTTLTLLGSALLGLGLLRRKIRG